MTVRRAAAPLFEHFDSRGFTHTRVAVREAHISPIENGVIGGHDAASAQRLVVVRGRVEVSTRDERAEPGCG